MENDSKLAKYALITRQIDLSTHISTEVLRTDADADGKHKRKTCLPVEPGTLIKVFRPPSDDNGKCIVQVLDFVSHDFIYENLYECPQSYLLKVPECVWPYVISIGSSERRLGLVRDSDKCRWLVNLKPNDLLSVRGELFRKEGTCFDCIVRYIGPVQELHPVGYFFGLEILHLDNGRSPQSEDIPFAIKYMQCDPSLSIFTTANWITPISNEVKKKLSARQLINDTIERVVTAIAPTNVGATTQRREKKPKLKQPLATAQFYDVPSPVAKEHPVMDQIKQKNASGNSDTEDTKDKKHLENEEFGMAVENYELSLERKLANSANQKAKKTGILKHGNSQAGGNSKEAPTGNLIMSLADRDIIVIDKADIKESAKNEVIVVDNPPNEDVDLADLLGANWPINAGGAAMMLNRSQVADAHKDDNKFTSTQSPPASSESSVIIRPPENFNIPPPKSQLLNEVPGTKLTIGSLVEVSDSEISGQLYGVIRWIGIPPNASGVLVGIELEDEPINIKNLPTSDGSYNGLCLFQCNEGRAIFVSPNKCNIDRRFIDVDGGGGSGKKIAPDSEAIMFGHVDCPPVLGAVAPLRIHDFEELEDVCGKFKGIQGHHNSCYLDATLFSMFTFTSVFDSLLYRNPGAQDISNYTEVQKVLRDEIVNPLRKNVFVRADRVMKLRKLLDQLSSVSGLTSEEKDPEEFLNSLLAQIMRVEPFLKLSSGQDSYFYQLFVEKDERLTFPTVQQLFEQSFHSSDIKLKEVPSCLIIQMPRFGKNYKMYPRILPSQVLDVTDIIEDSPRQCSVCGKLAEYECHECFGSLQGGSGLECTVFCQKCLNTVHMHAKRTNHVSKKLSVPRDFKIMAEHMVVPRLYMELFAVVCIETSHYVAFVKAGSGPDAPWCFFDSMADRKGEKNGYNIPEMISVRELPLWLSDEGARAVNETSTNDKMLPEHAKRLFCDAYMCMYQSTDVMMYH